MKTKTTWLIVLVLFIWGTIAYKIIEGRESEDIEKMPPIVKKISNLVESRENYPLALMYVDPFLKKSFQEKKVLKRSEHSKKNVNPVVAIPNIVIHWESIEYLGSIYNATRKTTLASLRINGIDHMAKNGEFINGFKVENITNDSIQLSFATQLKYIPKKE